MKLYRATFPSPIGLMRVLSDGTALRVLSFEDQDDWLVRHLATHYADGEIVTGDPTGIADTLDAYFSGDLTAIDGIPVAGVGTDFQRAVWALLCEIPVGTTTTYGALAKSLGKPPGASRAVGLANGSIVVPCHRVIGANGTLTGYAGGLPRKQWLLAHERVELDLKPPTLDYSPGLAR